MKTPLSLPLQFASGRPAPAWTLASVLLRVLFLLAAGVLAVQQPDKLVVVLLALVAITISWRWPIAALAFAFAAAPFQMDLGDSSSISFSAAEICLALAFFIYLLRLPIHRATVTMGPMAKPILLFLVWSLIVSLANWQGKDAIISLLQMVEYAVIAVTVFACSERPQRLIVCLWCLVASTTFLGLAGIAAFMTGTRSGLYILGLHKNGIGMSLSVGVTVITALLLSCQNRRLKLLLSACLIVVTMGLMFSLSRGSWVGAAAGLVVLFALRRNFRLLMRAFVVLVPVILVCWLALPKDSRQYAVDTNGSSMQDRQQFAANGMNLFYSSPLYGTGVGLRKTADPNNVYILCLAETGIVGLILFLGIFFVFGRLTIGLCRRLFAERNGPLFAVVTVAASINVNSLVHAIFDVYWGRGMNMMAFASMGMVVCVWRYVRQHAIEEPSPTPPLATAEVTP